MRLHLIISQKRRREACSEIFNDDSFRSEKPLGSQFYHLSHLYPPPHSHPPPPHLFPFGLKHFNHLSKASVKYLLLTSPPANVVLKSKQCCAFSMTYPKISSGFCVAPHSGGSVKVFGWGAPSSCSPERGDSVRQGSNSPPDQ